MGLGNWLGMGKDVAAPIKAIGDLYTTDKARILAEKEYEEIAQKRGLAQLENNKILAASEHIFNNAWQSLIGWSAGFLVLLYYAPQIVITTYIWGKTCAHTGIVVPFPMKADDILNLVWLLFGFGGYSLIKKKIDN